MKKSPTPKFICYDNDTPFRAEGTVIYGPLRQKNVKTGEVRINKYESFICDCDNEVMADAIVFYLNDAWQTGKMHGESQNTKQEPSPELPKEYNYVKDIANKDFEKWYKQMEEQRKKKEQTGKTESGKKLMEEEQKKLQQFEKLEEAKFIEKTPGWYEQKWDD
jgi:polyribonucleotide nucleotidyltransferase